MNIASQSRKSSGGFTVIELMIATVVFSMVLLVITVGVLSFSRSYYRGITQSNTQNAARSIIEAVSQAIQFSGGDITSPISATNGSRGFCIGSQRYSYILGHQLVDGAVGAYQSNRALVMDSPGNCGGLSAQDVRATPSGTELLSPKMRLAKLSVQQVGTTDMYTVNVRIVYGDMDLLYSPSGQSPVATAPDATCRAAIAGSQFCAVSELTTTVEKRINQSE